jgi:hypothetical protein
MIPCSFPGCTLKHYSATHQTPNGQPVCGFHRAFADDVLRRAGRIERCTAITVTEPKPFDPFAPVKRPLGLTQYPQGQLQPDNEAAHSADWLNRVLGP